MKAPAVALMRNLGLEPDPWQVEVLETERPRLILNCCRQAGKSTVVALLALAEAIWLENSKVLILSRSLRQSTELYRIIGGFYRQLGQPIRRSFTKGELLLNNASRIVCLPCNEETIRGFSGVTLLILDEASRVPDDMFRAVSPMLVASSGRMICLSTPRGKRGFFYEAWARGGDDWQRIEVPASKIPWRIKPENLARERRSMRDQWFRQEFECCFEVLEGLVYPDLPKCVVRLAHPSPVGGKGPGGPLPPGGEVSAIPPFHRRLGGMDFGYRSPFAAVWGGVDRDGVLWLTNEHYVREQILSYHAAHLPKNVVWYCDPHGPAERRQLRLADFKVNPGRAPIGAGIQAVQARIQTGRLKIVEGACPNLLAEAELYRYDEAEAKGSENPIDEYDHALDALRYLISRLDENSRAQPALLPDSPLAPEINAPKPPAPPVRKRDPWCNVDNEALWTRII